MTKLPAKELLDGTKNPETTTGEFRLAMGNLRQFLFDLFGDESTDKETARLTLQPKKYPTRVEPNPCPVCVIRSIATITTKPSPLPANLIRQCNATDYDYRQWPGCRSGHDAGAIA
ncbi:hypothetical protein [Oxalobacter paraformigenes]|uniref:Uncharacterized protein n=1 Tax=Oxalobacter paraformigenes TaxID=556268 RepID=T5LSU2_9BURK|nr:hypothetical protein [Oxalobacter paraformigenes]EQM95124.1 hypothetical protein OFAG_02348 [Oxalobacter paraformigenes]